MGGLAVAALLHAASADNTLVDSGLDAVVHLDVELRHLVVLPALRGLQSNVELGQR